jgi:hypothetical protein
MINYYLKADASGPVTLEIRDAKDKLVRRYSSTDKPEAVDEKSLPIPTYWIRPPQILSARSGSHRFIWDLHYPPPVGLPRMYPMTAIYRDTPSAPRGPAALPGRYTVKLTVGGRTITQPLIVKMDPRVKTPAAGLAQQFELSMQCYEGLRQSHEALNQIRKLREQLKALRNGKVRGALALALAKLDRQAAALQGQQGGRRGGRGTGLGGLTEEMLQLLEVLQGADAAPTTQAVTACGQMDQTLARLLSRWSELRSKDIKALNQELRQANLPPLTLPQSRGPSINNRLRN